MDDNRVTYFGETDARNKRVKFGIKAKDRTRHVYVIGKTGMGKSTLLENMAVQDIQNGEGMCFIDPHGKTADLLLEYVPKERIRDVIYIAPFDTDFPISFNVLESVDHAKRHLVVSGLMSTFKKIWVDAWSARMEYILTNTLLALLEAPNTTLLGVNRMLSDKAYRNEIVSHVQDPSVKSFWVKEFANYTERMAAEAVPSIQNKVGQFTANPLIRNMIGQPVSSFDFREAMDQRKIMIINLSKGKIGDENMKLLGGLLVTKIYLAAMSRADVPDRAAKMLPNFYLFVDEFQNFANASFADILSEARKYKLNLTIAHQYIEQMDEIVRPAVFGNVGTMITFRVGATDAEALEKEFAPQFTIEDLVNLGFAQIYLKLMIDGLGSSPFSAVTLPPIIHPDRSYVQDIIAASREQFAQPRALVEEGIVKFHEPTPPPAPSKPAAAPGSKPSAPVVSKAVVNPPAATRTGASTASAPKPEPKASIPTSVARTTVSDTQSPSPARTEHAGSDAASSRQPLVSQSKPPTQAVSEMSSSTVRATEVTHSVPLKPAPLSTLASKSIPKSDPKVRTTQNMNALKDALAAVMKKPAQSSPASVVSPETKAAPTSPVSQSVPVAPKTTPVSDGAPVPKEVPEGVLRKILKVE
jgi:energy-coupling factor transporter ATP-binding protein EcfA2